MKKLNINLGVLTNKSTEKYANIKNSKKIAFVITDQNEFITLQGKGQVSEVTGILDSVSAFNMLIKVIAKNVKKWPPPVGKIKDLGIVILKIKPTWLRLRDYANSTDFVSDFSE